MMFLECAARSFAPGVLAARRADAGMPFHVTNAATAEAPISVAKIAARKKVRRACALLIACRSRLAFNVARNFALGSTRRRCRKSSFMVRLLSPALAQDLDHAVQNGADIGFA